MAEVQQQPVPESRQQELSRRLQMQEGSQLVERQAEVREEVDR